MTKCISTSRPKGFDAFEEAVFRESERVPDFDQHDSSLERGKVHLLSEKFRQNECNRYESQLDRLRDLIPTIEKATSSPVVN